MLQTLFHKTDLMKAFAPLSQNGQVCLETLLIHPKTLRVEGRGFFNDPDFVLEACTPLAGRYNFGLSPFSYSPDRVPSRQAYNQFDRNLLEAQHQEHGNPHSLTVSFQFKPDLFRELDPAKGNHVLQVVYLIDAILERIPLKTFSLDFGGNAMTARFLPACASHYPNLSRAQYFDVTRKLIERIEKEMYPQEHKKFVTVSAALGKAWDPLPGTPLVMSAEEGGNMQATTAGHLQLANDALFQSLFEEVVQGPKSRTSGVYAPANLQGLSQDWGASSEEGPGLARAPLGQPHLERAVKEESHAEVGMQENRHLEEMTAYFQNVSLSRWRWPLTSQAFQRQFQGLACGEMLMLQCDPFGAETALHFLMQSAEGFARDQGGQMLIFSKRHTPGELALFTMARHLKQHPFQVRNGQKPADPRSLVQQFTGLFPCAPIFLACSPGENWENIMRYLEHDYLVRSKKNGATPPPLAILIDGAEDFRMPTRELTFSQVAQFKARLRDLNASLWLVDPLIDGQAPVESLLGLADYLAILDFDGSLSNEGEKGEGWEFSFSLDPQLRASSAELSLVRLAFQSHGSHRCMTSSYVHWAQAGLFKELQPPGQPVGNKPPG